MKAPAAMTGASRGVTLRIAMDFGDIPPIALVLLALSYLLYVNRRRQRYAGETVFEAEPEAVWKVLDPRPGSADWVPQLASAVWVDERAQDMLFTYKTGAEMRCRILSSDPPKMIATEASGRPGPDGQFGDLIRSTTWAIPLGDGRTHVRCEMEIERRPGFAAMRLGYPWLFRTYFKMARTELERIGALKAAPAAPAKPKASSVALQIALVLATLVWLSTIAGPWAGLGMLVMLVVHEYGHVWAMRRNGHETAKFYLVPFFGGVAIGARAFASEREAVEIFLMGPVFGLMPSLAGLLLFGASGDPFWASLAGFLAIVNGFNLAPIPPLDGGRVAQSLLRPLGAKAWYAASGALVLAGGALSAYFRLPGLLALTVLSALMWSAYRAPNPTTQPLSGRGLGLSVLVYAALIVLHVGVMVFAFSLDGDGALEQGPLFAQSSAD